MHMADALISPAVGGAMWGVTACLTAYAAKKVQNDLEERKVPLMGVLGAFVFAAQMINFSIPATGSSGHLGGGLLLAILLGPHAAFLTIASILMIQALFFADGGLLALGCNIFNLGFFPCYLAYPYIYKPIAEGSFSKGRILAASILAGVLGLQAGAFSVVLETLFSGISELPFGTFVLLMQPIHLAIGLVEGLVVAAVVSFLAQAAPHILSGPAPTRNIHRTSLAAFFCLALFIAGGLSWFASTQPDGLEWSIAETSGQEELTATSEVHALLQQWQNKYSPFPDYNFKSEETAEAAADSKDTSWPSVDAGKSVAGMLGACLTLFLAFFTGKALRYAAKHH